MPMALGLGLGLPYMAGPSGPSPALDLNFVAMAASQALDSRITYTGNSLATLTNSAGNIAYKPHNLLLRSEEFDNAAWTQTNLTVTPNAAAAPTGPSTMDLLVESATSATHIIRVDYTFTAGQYTASIYAKQGPGSARNVGLIFNTAGLGALFDATTGSVVVNAGVTTSATNLGGGIRRFSITATLSAGTDNVRIYLGSGTNWLAPWTGDGVSGVYVWGAQLNVGPLQPYYPTTGSAYFGPRFTYDPVTHAALGLLIEEQRTNLCTFSESLNSAGWTSTNQSVTLAAGTAPDGSSNANRITAAVGAGGKQTWNTVGSATTVTTNTVYAKAGTANWLALAFDTQGVTDGAFFNLSTGVIGTVTGGATATITPVGNGWYRCSATRTYASANHAFTVEVHTANAQGITWAAAGTETIYLWGAQLEAGATATSYIPTTSASVTRAADSAVMTGANFSSWFDAAQGTFVFENKPPSFASSPVDFCVNSGTHGLGSSSGGITSEWNGTANLDTANSATAGAARKAAVSYGASTRSVCLNAGAVATSGTVAFGATPAQLVIGSNFAGSSQFQNAPVARLRYYNTALINAQLQALTA